MICGHKHKKFKYPYPRDSKIIQTPYQQQQQQQFITHLEIMVT